jgi:hypothetical protein
MPRTEILGREEIMGRDEILGSDDVLGSVASTALHTTSKVAKKLVTLPIEMTERVFSATTKPLAHAFIGRDEILGTFIGDDEVCAAREGSHSDRRALQRRAPASTSGYNSHWAYIRGDEPSGEALEELRERAKAGDARAAAILEKRRRTTSSGEVTTSLTPAERAAASKISSAQSAAQAGDASASRKMVELRKEIPTLVAQAKAGNKKALRSLLVLRAAGVPLKTPGV